MLRGLKYFVFVIQSIIIVGLVVYYYIQKSPWAVWKRYDKDRRKEWQRWEEESQRMDDEIEAFEKKLHAWMNPEKPL